MSLLHLGLRTFSFAGVSIYLLVPEIDALRQSYETSRQLNPEETSVPFWGKIWPESLGLCQFLEGNREFIEGKKILELGAGLGLPGLFAAHFAKEVTLSDYDADAVYVIKSSVKLNQLSHVTCRILDWNALPTDLNPDVLLMSDVNYAQQDFELLFEVFLRFLDQRTTIILSTPHRLIAREFIERLIPFCRLQETQKVVLDEEETDISVLVLNKI